MVLPAFIVTASFAACQSEERASRLAIDDSGGIAPNDATPPLDSGDTRVALDALPEAASDDIGGDASFDAPEVSDTSDAVAPDVADAAEADAPACLPALTTSAAGACSSIVQSWPSEGATHHSVGTALTYCTRPPSSGDHFDIWASYRTYDKPVPYGYLVHSLEHGAVIILYKCASGSCPTIQSQLVAIADARPVDTTCVDPVKRRVIIAPDPTLDVDIGAAAWGWTYRASCVDAASLGKFIDDHYNKASEDVCADGVVPP